jgi:hypothetical protein
VLHQSTAWFTCQPWDSHTNLRSSGATATSFSSNSAMLLSLRSNRGQLGHHSRSHQLGTRATTMRRFGTLLRNITCQGKPTRNIPQHRWQLSRRASREAQRSDLAVPTTPPWRYPRGRKFLQVRSFSMNTPSLYCLILELHMIS